MQPEVYFTLSPEYSDRSAAFIGICLKSNAKIPSCPKKQKGIQGFTRTILVDAQEGVEGGPIQSVD